ncbi:MAG: hypothetical protein IJO91_06220 [Oscillospiraceae bacterium]|nr:hypothetical protein [Oscillospiraceae bacterium]
MQDIIAFLEEHIELFTLLLTIAGGSFALYQWRISVKNSKAEYVDKLLQRMQDDPDIRQFLTLNDYETEWYNEDFHEDHSEEAVAIKADRALFFFNYLCYLNQQKIIRKNEFRIFEYYMISVIQYGHTQGYMLDLYQYSLTEKREFPFTLFMDYGIKKRLMPKQFKDPDFFRYMMMCESGSGNFPRIYRQIYDSHGRYRLLYTYSRCCFCENFVNGACTKGRDHKEHFWFLDANICDDFIYVDSRWQNKNAYTYSTLKDKEI